MYKLNTMKKITIVSCAVGTLLFVQPAFAASDYLLKLDGVDGESTKNGATTEEPSVAAPVAMPIRAIETEAVACTMDARQCPDGTYVGRTGPKCEFVCPTTTGRVTPPATPTNPTPTPAGDPDFDLLKTSPLPTTPVNSRKGNVDAGWKVEEGESAMGEGNTHKGEIEILSADGKSADLDGDGMEDLVFSEPTATQSIYMKLGDIKGEKEGKMAPPTEEGKEIRKNITINLRAKELRGADEKTKADVLALAPTSTEAVRTGNDLALFILRDAMENPTIDSVDIVGDKIVIEHQAQGKFLGLFKMSYRGRAEVDTEGNVHVTLPWYSILINEDIDEEDIALVAKEKKKEKPMQIESWSFGASQAGMYVKISELLKEKYDIAKGVK
jgi:hypothetical protein